MDTEATSASPPQERMVRVIFGCMALLSLASGAALYGFADRLALDEDTARLLTTAFLLTAVADALVLYFWDRLRASKR